MIQTLREKWSALPMEKQRTLRRILGVTLGATAGFAFWALVGCNTGACPLTSNPWMSTGWGAVIGLTTTY
jgi:hypothetical protein